MGSCLTEYGCFEHLFMGQIRGVDGIIQARLYVKWGAAHLDIFTVNRRYAILNGA